MWQGCGLGQGRPPLCLDLFRRRQGLCGLQQKRLPAWCQKLPKATLPFQSVLLQADGSKRCDTKRYAYPDLANPSQPILRKNNTVRVLESSISYNYSITCQPISGGTKVINFGPIYISAFYTINLSITDLSIHVQTTQTAIQIKLTVSS